MTQYALVVNIQWIYIFGNKNLSIVVLTQNNLCNIIPDMKSDNKVYKNDIFNNEDNKYAPMIVIITSAIAKPINL